MRAKSGRPHAALFALMLLLAQAPLTHSQQNPPVPFKANVEAVAVGAPCGTFASTGTAAGDTFDLTIKYKGTISY